MILLSSTIATVLENTILPIFVCVVLPVLIVLIVMWKRKNEIDKRAEVAMKALEKGLPVENIFGEATASAPAKLPKSLKERGLSYFKTSMILMAVGLAMLLSSIFDCDLTSKISLPGTFILLLGLGFLAYYFIFNKTYKSEIEREESLKAEPVKKESETKAE